MRPRLTEDLEADDPILSVVNLIDVFLVIIAALLLAVAQSPLSSLGPFGADKLTVIRNPGAPDMEIVVKDGQKIERYKGSGGAGQGAGVKIGSAYRLPDGSLVYRPD
jgi:hypothetical protein